MKCETLFSFNCQAAQNKSTIATMGRVHSDLCESESPWSPDSTNFLGFSAKLLAENAEPINFALYLETTLPIFYFYRTQVSLVRSLCPSVRLSIHLWLNLTDVTLADEDTNSILTDNANRAIQGNVRKSCL